MKKLVLVFGGLGVLGQSCTRVLHEDKYDILNLDIKRQKMQKTL